MANREVPRKEPGEVGREGRWNHTKESGSQFHAASRESSKVLIMGITTPNLIF